MQVLTQFAYLTASVLFILGIKLMNTTHQARRGNQISAVGMLIATLATLAQVQLLAWPEILVCIAIGAAIGLYYAYKVEMTQMPEMVALFNGFGGLASVAVAISEYWRVTQEDGGGLNMVSMVTILLSVLVGSVTFTGSYIAFAKLNGQISGKAVVFRGQHPLNLALFLAGTGFGAWAAVQETLPLPVFVLLAISLALGVLTVIPIGGADMPVVISLLNSYSGIAACLTGFVLGNNVLIITGALVGSSGIILTQIMCKAMNRSLVSVLLGGFGATTGSGGQQKGSEISVKEISTEETALLFDSISSLIVVPGYGMAVAQAQHAIRELMDLLEKRGVNVRFAIHPVAGRMPGHMNVLLAEAHVPYEKLLEMDHINDDFANTDVVLIVGANDIVNPAARHNPQSPIYGMPILNADKARTVIVSKRSMAAGYAGIENELFGYPNCLMLFGDAKSSITRVVAELKSA
ncbi:MAG: NAD(P)(+) transhydrogenase (Re/Si-specific) subunit beta [Bacteroidia bacterium]|nr:NAD(P)(+) transhydrogenase (Re/Si-specific) subunit beta [Bacteroidia bacterium]